MPKRGFLEELFSLPDDSPLPPMASHLQIMEYGFGYIPTLNFLYLIPQALKEPRLATEHMEAEHCPSHATELVRRFDGELIGLKYLGAPDLAYYFKKEIPEPCPIDFFQNLLETCDQEVVREMTEESRQKMLWMRAEARKFLSTVDIPIHPEIVAAIREKMNAYPPR